jgi:hypothetical protein
MAMNPPVMTRCAALCRVPLHHVARPRGVCAVGAADGCKRVLRVAGGERRGAWQRVSAPPAASRRRPPRGRVHAAGSPIGEDEWAWVDEEAGEVRAQPSRTTRLANLHNWPAASPLCLQ